MNLAFNLKLKPEQVEKIKHTTLRVKLECNQTLNVTVPAVHLIQIRNDHSFNFRLKLEQVEKLKSLSNLNRTFKTLNVTVVTLKLEINPCV